MKINRHLVLKQIGFIILSVLISISSYSNRLDFSESVGVQEEFGFGPLKQDRRGVLDLPMGFQYKIISRAGDKMDDGFYVPHLPDGMAAFPQIGPRCSSTVLLQASPLPSQAHGNSKLKYNKVY